MNIRKIKEIVKFDVERNLQNKWFIILNILMLIIALIVTNKDNISKYLEEKEIDIINEEEVTLQILDNEEIAYDEFALEFEGKEKIKIEKVTENNYSRENVPKDNVILIEIEKDEMAIIKTKIVSKESVDGDLYNQIYETLQKVRSKIFAENNNINLDELNLLNDSLEIDRQYLGIDAENAGTKELIKAGSIVVLYMVLIFVLSRIANEITQEKVSKSIEYVLTSVSAKEYLLAKVLGTTISIIIQVIYTFVYYMIGNMIANLISEQAVSSSAISTNSIDMSIVNYILVMVAYLIFTVFLTSLIQATLSSKTTSVAEAGNSTLFLMSIMMVLYFISLAVISPYNKVSAGMYVFSCLPIVSTFFVPSMMIIGQATIWQIIISFVLLIISIPLIFNKCAKYFKNGILDYNISKRKGLLNKKKELSLKEQQALDLRNRKVKKVGFTLGISMMILFLLEVICSLIITPVLTGILSDKVGEGTLFIIENSILLIIVLGLTSLFIKHYDTEYEKNKKGEAKINALEYILGGISIIALTQILLAWIYPKIGLDHSMFDVVNIFPDDTALGNLAFIVGMALVPAIFEELLFRKYILNCSKKLGTTFAIVFSALLFGLYHMNLNQAIFAFLIGILFGVIAVKTDGIILTVFLHFLNNMYSCMISLLPNDNIWYKIINKGSIALAIIGGIIIIKNIPKLKNIKKQELKINPDAKLLFKNYTFVIAMALLIILLAVTEKMITTI